MTESIKTQQTIDGAIGIFINRQKWRKLQRGSLGTGLAALAQAADDLEICPLWFSLPQRSLDSGLIRGAIRKNGELVSGNYPLPKVLYDLGVFRKEELPEAKRIRRTLTENGTKFVNNRTAFSKWTTHQILSGDSYLAEHLPSTVYFSEPADFDQMLSYYRKLCVKSVWGSRGKEVLFVTKLEKGLSLIYPDGVTKLCVNTQELADNIRLFMGDQRYIIQQYIELATWEGRCFDIRALIQKNHSNEWACTALCLRLARKGQRITSTGYGSEVMELQPILGEKWPNGSDEIIALLKELAMCTARKLEAEYGPLGELGIDIGVDSKGLVWLFEVNSKPGKVTIRKLKQKNLLQQAYRRPLAYAKKLLEDK